METTIKLGDSFKVISTPLNCDDVDLSEEGWSCEVNIIPVNPYGTSVATFTLDTLTEDSQSFIGVVPANVSATLRLGVYYIVSTMSNSTLEQSITVHDRLLVI